MPVTSYKDRKAEQIRGQISELVNELAVLLAGRDKLPHEWTDEELAESTAEMFADPQVWRFWRAQKAPEPDLGLVVFEETVQTI